MLLPSNIELEAERARRSLRAFTELGWPLFDPASTFVCGLHVDAICDHLEAVARGEIRRLLINIPPRHGKSLITSVAFPAWVWISQPQVRFMCASYGIDLAIRDSLRTRQLIQSGWYQDRFGQSFSLSADQSAKARFENDRGGLRLATSVGGAATGEGGDIIALDDPHKIDQAASAAHRQTTIDWFDGVISTRLNDPRTGAIIVIGQRVHERDLFGHLLARGGWTHLCLPAEYDPAHPYLWSGDPRTEPGQLLCPERFGPPEIEALKQQLGSYGAAGQLQQLPAPAGGGIFQRTWWQWYDPAGPLPPFDELLQSWDLSFTGGPNADYVVGQLWALAGAKRYLLHQIRGQFSFTQTLDAVRQLTDWAGERFPRNAGHMVLIEKAANAAAAFDVLRDTTAALLLVPPEGDKTVRAHAVSPQIEAGNVYLPGAPDAHGHGYDRARTPEWVQGLVEETAAFPTGAYDDQVDALTQALQRAGRRMSGFRVLSPRQ